MKNMFFIFMLTITLVIFPNISYASLEDIEKHWCKDEIEIMYENGYIESREEDLFKPDEYITKAEFCMTVNKVLDYCNIGTQDEEWEEKHFAVGIEKGYMPIGSVEDTITREEACVIFERISDITIDNALQSARYEEFTDFKQVSVWAEKSVKRLVINGKIIGYTDNTLKMKNKLTRAEFVMIMSRFDETLDEINVKDISKNISLDCEVRFCDNITFIREANISSVDDVNINNKIIYFIIPKKNNAVCLRYVNL